MCRRCAPCVDEKRGNVFFFLNRHEPTSAESHLIYRLIGWRGDHWRRSTGALQPIWFFFLFFFGVEGGEDPLPPLLKTTWFTCFLHLDVFHRISHAFLPPRNWRRSEIEASSVCVCVCVCECALGVLRCVCVCVYWGCAGSPSASGMEARQGSFEKNKKKGKKYE